MTSEDEHPSSTPSKKKYVRISFKVKLSLTSPLPKLHCGPNTMSSNWNSTILKQQIPLCMLNLWPKMRKEWNLLAQENGGIWSMMAHEPLVNNWLSQTTSTASIFLPYQTSFPPNYQPMHTPIIQT